MDTQNDFLDNAVNDELDIGQEVDMQSQMCSYLHDDMDENCSLLQSDTRGDCMFVRAKGVGKGERVVRLRGFFRKLGFEARPLKRRSCFIWKHIYFSAWLEKN